MDNEKLHLILAIHNHQPVGNFDHVIEEAYRKAYLPFLKLLQKHLLLKVVLHYSGSLLSWMAKNHPEAIDILKGFVRDQRVEFLSGGFYEPILSVVPEADRLMQVKELTDYIARLLNYKARGMWLAERVWEPQMPKYLSAAGIDYFPLDDYHFKLSGLNEDDLSGYFITEENGSSIAVFPGSERLRYSIPFRDVKEIMSYLNGFHGSTRGRFGSAPLITMADDGEKFGVWPETHKHCYDGGWLERFFSAIEANAHWIETTTFSEYRAAFRPLGTVYLPTASYREMGEWVLPTLKRVEYEHILVEMEKLFGEKAKDMMQGGIWRSFFSKYPESNHIHKRMLMISKKVHGAIKESGIKSRKSTKAGTNKIQNVLHELWMGQCNDAYWHGIFGGLYLPHLRSSLYRHLITAESLAEGMLNKRKRTAKGSGTWKAEGDLDCDGFRDICLGNKAITAFFTGQGGSLVELSLKDRGINILDTLTRRSEAYHSRLSEAIEGSGGTKTIHERISFKEEGLLGHLFYDRYRRSSLLDHFFSKDVVVDSLMKGNYDELGDFITGIYDMSCLRRNGLTQVKLVREGVASGERMRIDKVVELCDSRIGVSYELEGSYSGIFGIEFNISLLGSPHASIVIGEKNLLIKDKGTHEGIKGFSLRGSFLNFGLTFSFDEEISLLHYPVETISLSEDGIERIYQGTAFLFMKRLDFSGRKKLGFTVDFRETK